MRHHLLFLIISFVFSSCKNVNKDNETEKKVSQEAKRDSSTIISKFEIDIRKFKEFEPYMIDDIPLADEYSQYFENPNEYFDESLVLLQKEDIPNINKTIIACIIRNMSLEDYLNFCEKAYILFQTSKIEEQIFMKIIGNASQGCQSPFFDAKNRGNKKMNEFLERVIKSPFLSEDKKNYIKSNY